MGTHSAEVEIGERFEFGENWTRFLSHLKEPQIDDAVRSLQKMLNVSDLRHRTFVDAGCGSGLFSLAARKMGAEVHSFDFDPQSVACTKELRNRYFPDDPRWRIEEASVLDTSYLERLGQFDVVYSWGGLHHTGAMWKALDNVSRLVKPGGLLFIAIYNDQGIRSNLWTWVKRLYNRTPRLLRFIIVIPAFFAGYWPHMVLGIVRLRPFQFIREYDRNGRGMNIWRDLIDWVGGYPFEVAKPGELFDFYHERGFQLEKLTTCAGSCGNNQLVLRRQGVPAGQEWPQIDADARRFNEFSS